MDIAEQVKKKFVVGSYGKYAVCLEEGNAHFGWLFQAIPDGGWFSLRLATPEELSAAKSQLELLPYFI